MVDVQLIAIAVAAAAGIIGGGLVLLLVLRWYRRSAPPAAVTPPTPQPTVVMAQPPSGGEASPVIEVDTGVVVSQLVVENFRSFSRLEMNFQPPSETGRGQWVLLLGDNGVGKSTILRSLVLALADPAVSSAVLQTAPAPYVRRGTERATIRLDLAPSLIYGVALVPGRPAERLLPLTSDPHRPGLFAYGPLRGSALGRSARQVSFLSTGSVATLFDEASELIHAETWLMQLQLAALRSRGGPDEAFFDAVTTTMRELLPGVQTLEVTSGGVVLSGPEVGDSIPLAGMSDAYLGTMGWVLDLIARWSNRFQRVTGRAPDGSLASSARGVVAIDEIGLHLHPLWQTTVVRDLRAMFPNLTFIVTSHNPLVLLGAREGEVHVLRRNAETREIEIEQANVPPGTTADQILTGRWFNLPSTLDQGTQQLLEEHRGLLRRGADEQDPRVNELQDKLRQRLGTFADTSIDRMALQVAAQVMDETDSSFEQLSPEGRDEMRQRMLRQLRERSRSR